MAKQYSLPFVYFVIENKIEFEKAFGIKAGEIGTDGDGCVRSETTDGRIVVKDRKLGGLPEPDEDGNIPIASDLEAWGDIKTIVKLEEDGYVTSYAADSVELKALMPTIKKEL